MSRLIFIYALCEPGTRTVRYIGQSVDPQRRFSNHLRDSIRHRSHLGNWLRSLSSRGTQPELVIIRSVQESQWQSAEMSFIRIARALGMRLVNSSDGGEGLLNPTQEVREKKRRASLGRKASLETRLLISQKAKCRRMSDETRAQRAAHFKSLPREVAAEIVERMACKVRGVPKSPEQRAKMSAAAKGRRKSAEHVAAMRGRTRTPEHRAALRAANLGKPRSPESLIKQRATWAAKKLLQSTPTPEPTP